MEDVYTIVCAHSTLRGLFHRGLVEGDDLQLCSTVQNPTFGVWFSSPRSCVTPPFCFCSPLEAFSWEKYLCSDAPLALFCSNQNFDLPIVNQSRLHVCMCVEVRNLKQVSSLRESLCAPTVQVLLRESQIISESKDKQIAELKMMSEHSADSLRNEWEKKVRKG